jgi:hypothetical protein
MQNTCTNIQTHGHLVFKTPFQISTSAVGTAAPAMAAVPPSVAYTHLASLYTSSLPRTKATPKSRKAPTLNADVVTSDPADAEEAAAEASFWRIRVLVRPSCHTFPLSAE